MTKKKSNPTPSFHHKHVIVSTRPKCPVCNGPVYSLAGVHPQCAAKRNDDEHKAAVKAETLAATVIEGTAVIPAAVVAKSTPSRNW